ncbi:hypothetical protein EIP86_005712 [Pleurotus ostreatoroseus]|nr:hypothetical protein EIP86_005712 [Pleurotus ostreatoroseus]
MPTVAENATIAALTARITALEEALKTQTHGSTANGGSGQAETDLQSASSSRGTSEPEPSNTTEPCREWENVYNNVHCDNGPRSFIDHDVQVAAVALAQLSMAPRAEYIGGGTLVCALNKFGDTKYWKFPYSSTMLTSPSYSKSPKAASQNLKNLSPIRDLVRLLPPRCEVERLLRLFFAECNWQFGLSEKWFLASMQRMWEQLSLRCTPTCNLEGGCPACKEEINPHWLVLLFSMLALVPASEQTVEDSTKYFTAAMTARRVVDDILLASPVYSTSESAVYGSVLSCIAAVLLAIWQGDRGRLSEAWKLIGHAIRSAQAIGLHRDPRWRKWETMHQFEIELRVTAWWLLMISDRLYSFVLGRPVMVPRGSFDVQALPTEIHSDGTPNLHGMFSRSFITLSALIAEAAEKCLGIKAPSYATVLEMDRRFVEWKTQLPPRLHWDTELTKTERSSPEGSSPPTAFPEGPCPERQLTYQKHTLAGWYLSALMNVHRPYLMHAPLLPDASVCPELKAAVNPSRERCIENATELLRLMTSFHDRSRGWSESGSINSGIFSYFIFDGAVVLAGALSQVPPHPKSEEFLALMDKAMRVLKDISDATEGAQDGQGEMARRAMTVLKALRRAGGWDISEGEKGDLVLLQHVLEKENRRRRQQQEQEHQSQFPQQRTASDPVASFAGGTSQTAPVLGSAGSGSDLLSFGASYATSATAFGLPVSSTGGASYSQYGNAPLPLPDPFAASLSGAPAAVPESASSASSGIPLLSPFPGIDMSYSGLASPSPFYTGPSRPVQSTLMPFDVLQGVQPDVQGTVNIDLDWARLAGMESWYSNGATFSPMDGPDNIA